MSQVAQPTLYLHRLLRSSPRLGASCALGAFAACAAAALWLPIREARNVCLGLAITIVIVALYRNYSARGSRVPPPNGAPNGWWVAVLTTVALCGAMALAALLLGIWSWQEGLGNVVERSASWYAVKLATIALQQVALLFFVVPLLKSIVDKSAAVSLIGATIFSALHLPNPLLVILTWFAGLLWIEFYLVFRLWQPVMLSHAVLALALASFGGEYVLHMRVGSDCVSLLPQYIPTEQGLIGILPSAVTGQVDEVIQCNDIGVIRCQAKSIHASRRPAKFCLIEAAAPAERRPRVKMDACQVRCNDQGLEVYVRLDDGMADRTWKLYAANHEGWWTDWGESFRWIAPDCAPRDRLVQLYPLRIDGRCENLQLGDGELLVSGWMIAVNRPREQLQLGVCCGRVPSNHEIPTRVVRSDIARSFPDAANVASGFELTTSPLGLNPDAVIDLYAVDGNSRWHPLRKTAGASPRFARGTPQAPGSVGR